MDILNLRRHWEKFAKSTPYFSVITDEKYKNPNKEDLKDFFCSGQSTIRDIFKRINSLNLNLEFNKSLDFGCGVGRLSLPLSQKFKTVLGVDISKSMTSIAKTHAEEAGITNCSFVNYTKNNLSFIKSNTLDFVLTIIVLQHMKKKYALNYIRDFCRVLKPGGILYFQLPEPADQRDANFWRRIQYMKVEAILLFPIVFILKKFIFLPLMNITPSLFSLPRVPEMQMHGVLRTQVEAELQKCNMNIIDVFPDTWAGKYPGQSYTYIVQKKLI